MTMAAPSRLAIHRHRHHHQPRRQRRWHGAKRFRWSISILCLYLSPRPFRCGHLRQLRTSVICTRTLTHSACHARCSPVASCLSCPARILSSRRSAFLSSSTCSSVLTVRLCMCMCQCHCRAPMPQLLSTTASVWPCQLLALAIHGFAPCYLSTHMASASCRW